MRKLDRVRGFLGKADEGLSTYEVGRQMFPDAKDFHLLLALEEAAAHVEYLYEHGELHVTNLSEVEREEIPSLKYRLI